MITRQLSPGDEHQQNSRKAVVFDEFSSFLNINLTVDEMQHLRNFESRSRRKLKLPSLGLAMHVVGCRAIQPPVDVILSPSELCWSERLAANVEHTIDTEYKGTVPEELSELLSLIGRYIDVCHISPVSSFHRIAYCGHVLNHVMRTRNLVLANKKKLQEAAESGSLTDELIECARDQGFARPTVVILASLRKDAYDIVRTFKRLIFGEGWQKNDVLHNGRFEDEFGGTDKNVVDESIPDDLREIRHGNNDDFFRLTIGLSRRSLKLFVPFEAADILLCSPVALRSMVAEGAGDQHLVSTIQILIIEKADILLQQSWEHLPLIMSALHSQPNKISTDVSRVRGWMLEGQAAAHCQTLFFSSHRHELFSALCDSRLNHRGFVSFKPPSEGHLLSIELPLCQEIRLVTAPSAEEQSDARFLYFKDKVLPELGEYTAIFIPSYFDYTRIRNFLKKEGESFVQCHEYAKSEKITRARDMFFHGRKKLLLITERFHFFNRYRIKGIRRLLFYQAPSRPSFYADLINMCQPQGRLHATLLFTLFDKIRLENIFGFPMGPSIYKSGKAVQVVQSD